MMKRIICLFLCGVFLIISSYSIAGDGKEHERDLESIFLGRTLSDGVKDPKKSLINPDNPAVLFGYLEDAIYLCIDQMGNEGQKWLDELNNDYHMEELPKSIDEISVPVKEHEMYTHMGWDYKDYTLKEKWELRQNILLATVSKVFGFAVGNSSKIEDRYSRECILISKLIYYIHILGDHAENSLETTTDRIQLRNAKRTRGEVEAGLINELRQCLSELFEEQKTSMKYNRLMVKLNVVRFRAWITGEESSNEEVDRNSAEYKKNEKLHERIQDIAKNTLEYLKQYVRKLLLGKQYFKRVFGGIVVVE